jgi:hypothetical protein
MGIAAIVEAILALREPPHRDRRADPGRGDRRGAACHPPGMAGARLAARDAPLIRLAFGQPGEGLKDRRTGAAMRLLRVGNLPARIRRGPTLPRGVSLPVAAGEVRGRVGEAARAQVRKRRGRR